MIQSAYRIYSLTLFLCSLTEGRMKFKDSYQLIQDICTSLKSVNLKHLSINLK